MSNPSTPTKVTFSLKPDGEELDCTPQEIEEVRNQNKAALKELRNVTLERDELREAIEGAAVIANHAGARIKELAAEVERYRAAMKQVFQLHGGENCSYAHDIINAALAQPKQEG